MTKDYKNRLRGLKSARTITLRNIAAIESDINYGHPFYRHLIANQRKLAMINAKIDAVMLLTK